MLRDNIKYNFKCALSNNLAIKRDTKQKYSVALYFKHYLAIIFTAATVTFDLTRYNYFFLIQFHKRDGMVSNSGSAQTYL